MLKRNWLTILSVLILFTSGFTQRPERMKPMQKMEELKKIKLIEILQMNEETSIKFFTRRSEHMRKMDDLNQANKEKMDRLDEMLNDREEKSDQVLKKAIDDYMQIQDNIVLERQNFIKSASEVLTIEQFGKFLVFEEKFRNEIGGLLFRERNKRMRDD
jgi:hypothetical protein